MALASEPEKLIISNSQFSDWDCLNDSIMGGNSHASCEVVSDGLLINGLLVEEGGGFISCRSPVFQHPLNLSEFTAFQVDVDGRGRTLKFAVACRDRFLGVTDLVDWGLRWVTEFPTNQSGTTKIRIPFKELKPTIRAKSVSLPIKFDSSSIIQFQLLHSKFGLAGKLNTGFRPGKIEILFRSIRALR